MFLYIIYLHCSNIVKVTFWDEFAVYFDQLLKQKFDYPLIIIIGSCKVTKWNGMKYYSTNVFFTLEHYYTQFSS